jgi:branched-chain amino acid transport system substrate-binding protein
LPAQGEAANGIKTTLHYADNLDNPANKALPDAFKAKTGNDGDIYAVQGYDAAALFDIGLDGGWRRCQGAARKMIAGHGQPRRSIQPARAAVLQQGAQPDPEHLSA